MNAKCSNFGTYLRKWTSLRLLSKTHVRPRDKFWEKKGDHKIPQCFMFKFFTGPIFLVPIKIRKTTTDHHSWKQNLSYATQLANAGIDSERVYIIWFRGTLQSTRDRSWINHFGYFYGLQVNNDVVTFSSLYVFNTQALTNRVWLCRLCFIKRVRVPKWLLIFYAPWKALKLFTILIHRSSESREMAITVDPFNRIPVEAWNINPLV